MMLFSVDFGVYGPHIYRPPKTASSNIEPIAMKFGTKILFKQEIIMGYMSSKTFLKNVESYGNPPLPLPNFFLLITITFGMYVANHT